MSLITYYSMQNVSKITYTIILTLQILLLIYIIKFVREKHIR